MSDRNHNLNPVQLVLSKLDGVEQIAHGRWIARCPAHNDTNPSLSIAEGDDGRALVYCHAGCSVEAIVEARGLSTRDLFPVDDAKNENYEENKRVMSRRRGTIKKTRPSIYRSASDAVAALERQHGKRSGLWTYHDAEGQPVGMIIRWDTPAGKDIRPVSRNGDGWFIGGMPEPRPLYHLHELADAQRVYICEGEKAADAARSIGLTATTSPHGSKSAAKADWSPLTGNDVVILPDNDDPGRKYAETVAAILLRLTPPATVRIVELPDLPEGGDIVDFVDAHGDAEPDELRQEVEALADAAEPIQPQQARPRSKSQATRLVELARSANLFHNADGDAYATVPVDQHRETWPVRSKGFKRWLSRQHYLCVEATPNNQAVQDALNGIEGQAVYDGAEHEVFVRLAEHDEHIYIDLCNREWQVVEISSSGWTVVDNPPVRFRRAKAMLPLPTPARGGSVEALRNAINVTPDDWPLVVAWLLAAMRPTGPYPVLCLHGEQGSAKSTTARVLRELVDPNTAPLRSTPREPRDLMIAANNGWVVTLDNLSSLPLWFSDCLCRLSTGGGFSTRTLYENDEETIFDSMRPVIVNGIEDLATRGDLLDRSLLVTLPTIVEAKRLAESEFWEEFERCKPKLLGAILDAVSEAMRRLPDVKPERLPRMADFALWAMAGEEAMGLEPGEFLACYEANRQDANEVVLESSPVTTHVLGLVDGGSWEGRVSDLLEVLEREATDGEKRLKSWPKTPRGLSGCLRRLAPNLRAMGIDVNFARESGGKRRRIIIINRSDPPLGAGRKRAQTCRKRVAKKPKTR